MARILKPNSSSLRKNDARDDSALSLTSIQWESVLAAADLPVAILTSDCLILRWNAASAALAGVSHESALGAKLTTLFHISHADEVRLADHLKRVCASSAQTLKKVEKNKRAAAAAAAAGADNVDASGGHPDILITLSNKLELLVAGVGVDNFVGASLRVRADDGSTMPSPRAGEPLSASSASAVARKTPSQARAASTKSLAQQLTNSQSPLALVVDDDAVLRTVTAGLLQSMGFACETVGDGAQALRFLDRFRFDVVMMDCMMDGMDGFVCTSLIRQRERGDRRLPIIALTASADDPAARQKCFDAGMNDVVEK